MSKGGAIMRILSVVLFLWTIFVAIHTTTIGTGISVASLTAYLCVPGAFFVLLYINNPVRLQDIKAEKERQRQSNQTE
jgi:uncharacterized membrane protein